MMKIICRLVLLLALVSCYHSKPQTEFDMKLVISADSMVTLLVDMHLAEGIISTVKDKPKPAGTIASEYFDYILKKHQISRESYEESLRYYAYHAEKMDIIYEKVIIDLGKIESMSRPDNDDQDTLK